MIIGIDPDISKNGIAWIYDANQLDISNMSFVDVMTFIQLNKPIIKCVYLEAGWLNKKANWHNARNVCIAASIGRKVGENHATGKLLQQNIEAVGVKVELVKPTSKKLNQLEFQKLTKFPTRTNQEQRDAAMLIFGRAY
jgi:hypothetical protein